MALFKTAEGEYFYSNERGLEYGFYYRLYEDDGKDGLARAIVTQMPGSPPIAEIHPEIRLVLDRQLEYRERISLYFEHLPPEVTGSTNQFFLIDEGIREEVTEQEVAFWIIPHPVETSWSLGDTLRGEEGEETEEDDFWAQWYETDGTQLTFDFEEDQPGADRNGH
jgi:hypothetical protein